MTHDLTPINAVNPDSYGVYDHDYGPHARKGEPNGRERFKLEVEFILDMVPGAFHNPEDLVNWLMQNPYITSVTFNGEVEA